MSETPSGRIVKEQMKSGKNCCQAVIIAASQAFDISVQPDTMAAASMFGGGMGSGCSCGALTGMIMASGVFEQYTAHPLGGKLAQELHDQFKQQFGATCCRVIKSRRGSLANIGNRACIELTSQAAALLIKEWEGILDAETSVSIHSYSDSK
ncbi:MAG: C-GCAxxG-C-C family protein [Deltaproteobacteria bacterium]